MPGAHRRLACLALLSGILTLPALAADTRATAVCVDRAGGQTFFVDQTERDGRITALQVAKVDHSGTNIDRLLVFTAGRGALRTTDSSASGVLLLSFASDADAWQLIASAHIVLATEGEAGPIIEAFRLRHDNGEVLRIIEADAPLPCRGSP